MQYCDVDQTLGRSRGGEKICVTSGNEIEEHYGTELVLLSSVVLVSPWVSGD